MYAEHFVFFFLLCNAIYFAQEIIPCSHGEQLATVARSRNDCNYARYHTFPGGMHDDTWMNPDYIKIFRQFVDDVATLNEIEGDGQCVK